MKKMIFALALLATVSLTSCKNDVKTSTTTTDSTVVSKDSVKVETKVDTVKVVKDSVK